MATDSEMMKMLMRRRWKCPPGSLKSSCLQGGPPGLWKDVENLGAAPPGNCEMHPQGSVSLQ